MRCRMGSQPVLMVLWGRHSDRTGERVWHNAVPIGAIVAVCWRPFLSSQLWPMVALLTLVLVGTRASKGPFWALATEFLAAPVAAAGIAQINALGNLSGFAAELPDRRDQGRNRQLSAVADADHGVGGDWRRGGGVDRPWPAASGGSGILNTGEGEGSRCGSVSSGSA